MITKPNILKRALATIFDYTILFLLFYLCSRTLGEPDPVNGGYTLHLPEGFIVFLLWPVYIIVIERIYGATLGHRLFNLEVISLRNSKLTTAQVIKRRFCDPFDILWMFGLLAFILVKNTRFHQRLGDIWAKTIVIDKSDPMQATMAVV